MHLQLKCWGQLSPGKGIFGHLRHLRQLDEVATRFLLAVAKLTGLFADASDPTRARGKAGVARRLVGDTTKTARRLPGRDYRTTVRSDSASKLRQQLKVSRQVGCDSLQERFAIRRSGQAGLLLLADRPSRGVRRGRRHLVH